MQYRNFGIKSAKGKFYESHKTKPAVAHEEFEKDGTTYYHVLYDQLEGELHSVKIDESDYGTHLKVSLTDAAGDAQVLKFPLFRKGSEVDDWAAAFAPYIDQLNVGDKIALSLNQKEKDKNDYLYKNFFVSVDGTWLKQSFKWGDVPRGVKTTIKDKVTKKDKDVWDFTDRNAFLYEKIETAVNLLQPASTVPAGTQFSDEPDDTDSLPF
jgi:hypothetical protein